MQVAAKPLQLWPTAYTRPCTLSPPLTAPTLQPLLPTACQCVYAHVCIREAGATAAEHHSTAAQSLEEVEAAKQAAHAESNRLRAEASAAADAAMTHALAHGLKVVVDCTFAKDSPDKEVRELSGLGHDVAP